MTQAIKGRILAQVRARIQSGANAYICDALDEIAASDHRRNIQQLCDEIRQAVRLHLGPHRTFSDLAAWRPEAESLHDVTAMRVKWLDKQIKECK